MTITTELNIGRFTNVTHTHTPTPTHTPTHMILAMVKYFSILGQDWDL